MSIKYNHLSIMIISLFVITALANYAFAKTRQKCFTCVCKTNHGTTVITKPNCNFESLLTNKSVEDLPNDIKKDCIKNCHEQNQTYEKHLIWSE